MKLGTIAATCVVLLLPKMARSDEPRLLTKVTPLPVALSDDFEFRKVKLYFLGEKAERFRRGSATSLNPGTYSDTQARRAVVSQDSSLTFERSYRLFGAVTRLDQQQRFGDYLDFFWRVRRPADVTVRLEYRQERLHDHIQAQEISYANVRGTHKTEFKVVGDDYLDDGRVTAWRCLLIENGQVVAERRSFMWD